MPKPVQNMPKQLKVSYRDELNPQDKELTSKDLTRKGLFLYIFDDFFRGFYLVGCVFLDGVIVPSLRFILPYSGFHLISAVPSSLNLLFTSYVVMLIIFLELLLIYLEIKGFRKIWKRGSLVAMEKEVKKPN